MNLSVDRARLMQSLEDLAKVGGYLDGSTGLWGVNRLALTDADRDGRRVVRDWFEAAGLDVRVDRIGNVFGRRPGADPNAAPVVTGSHIDSVPTGGAFDGVLGVLSGLEAVRTLDDHAVRTRRPIEVAFFTDEEGARFGTDMLGSAVACGRMPLEAAYALTDERGLTVRGELARIGFLGEAPERVPAPHAFVEVHIEQGPILAAAGADLGVVTGVQAISWQEVTIRGKSAHAGTTPMDLRKDAGYAAALINVRLHEMSASGKYGEQLRVTMGRVESFPNRINIVPGSVICTVDLRNPHDDLMSRAEVDLARYFEEIEQSLGVTISTRQTARTQRISFDEAVQGIIAKNMAAAGCSYEHILSGAGHDAQEFAALCPTAMIFVPGEFDGISHNPRERSTPEACERGANILLRTLVDLANS